MIADPEKGFDVEYSTTDHFFASRDASYDRYALEYGPLLMSLVGGTDLNIPSGNLIGSLSPVSGSPLEFTVAGHPNCKYMPYWQIESETFTCFPTSRQ